ncbi:MAG TPA: electron transfer flavoprotein subunit beta [Clostridiales bacterium]|jgi:electron transfer flavoprotein beta subunit|nr:electron transfer flavoprotein subunit beta [Clostridiales bacterium]
MKILVFVKQVPDTDDVKLDPKTGNIMREGVPSTINPLDANAIEAAIQLKEKHGGTIAAISMGPPQAEDALKKALALGCDEAYLLCDRALGGADTRATAYALAKAAEKIGDYDLLLFGRHAIDGDTAQTGPATASFLDVPQITLAASIAVEDGWVICDRVLENTVQKVKAKLPAAVTVTADINTPRYATPLNIMKALKKPRTIWSSADLNCDPNQIGQIGSPSSTKKIFEPPKRNTDTKYFTGNPEDMAVAFVDMLAAEHLV